MTGRALYDRYCDARDTYVSKSSPGVNIGSLRTEAQPVAWPFLPWNEKRMWALMAARLRPQRKAAR